MKNAALAGGQDHTMQISPYLSFKGECEAAFTLYAQCLGGQLGPLFRYGDSPMSDQVPTGWQGKVMHASVTIGNQVLMGSDVAPDRYEEPRGTSLSIQMTSTTEAERVFNALSAGGSVTMAPGPRYLEGNVRRMRLAGRRG